MCPEMLCQKGCVREGVSTNRTLMTPESLPVNPGLMPFQSLLAAKSSATQITHNVTLEGTVEGIK